MLLQYFQKFFVFDYRQGLKKPINYFITCLTLLGVFSLLFNSFHLIGGVLWTVLSMLASGIGIYFLTKIINDFTFESSYFKFVFILLSIYLFTLIVRGLSLSYTVIKELILEDSLLWPFIIPIFVFFNKRLSSFVYLLNAIYFLGVAFLLVCLVNPSLITNRNTAETFIHTFVFSCGLLLLNARYISDRKKIVSFVALLVGFLSLTYLARRNGVVSYGALLIFGLLINITSLKGSQFFKLIPIFCTIFIFLVIGLEYMPASLTSRLAERVTEDSRSVVFTDLFKDMEDHMVFGKGMKGEYYSPSGGELEDEGVVFISQDYRNGIENGYLQLFLNGGIIYDVLFLLVTLPAAIIGFFYSKNQFVKSFAIIIFLWLIDMTIYGVPRLLLEYILVWIGVGVCYKKSLRQLTNTEVAEAFKKIE